MDEPAGFADEVFPMLPAKGGPEWCEMQARFVAELIKRTPAERGSLLAMQQPERVALRIHRIGRDVMGSGRWAVLQCVRF